jgi:hypothetical protein
MSDLGWLFEWFKKQCDGDWEHGNGISIGTLDNPGWFIKISLHETDVQDCHFMPIEIERTEEDWLYCTIEDGLFKGYGGPFNLPEILQIFRNWAENSTSQKLE